MSSAENQLDPKTNPFLWKETASKILTKRDLKPYKRPRIVPVKSQITLACPDKEAEKQADQRFKSWNRSGFGSKY